jgi:signal transduction histidine kinase
VISATQAGDSEILLMLSDNGVGIPLEKQGRVFDPFFTTRLGQGGSGLGLYIVYNIVTSLLGGHIQLISNRMCDLKRDKAVRVVVASEKYSTKPHNGDGVLGFIEAMRKAKHIQVIDKPWDGPQLEQVIRRHCVECVNAGVLQHQQQKPHRCSSRFTRAQTGNYCRVGLLG